MTISDPCFRHSMSCNLSLMTELGILPEAPAERKEAVHRTLAVITPLPIPLPSSSDTFASLSICG